MMKYEKSNEEHPSNESLANLIDRTLGVTERRSIKKHLLSCVDCRSVVMESFKEKRGELQTKREKAHTASCNTSCDSGVYLDDGHASVPDRQWFGWIERIKIWHRTDRTYF